MFLSLNLASTTLALWFIDELNRQSEMSRLEISAIGQYLLIISQADISVEPQFGQINFLKDLYFYRLNGSWEKR